MLSPEEIAARKQEVEKRRLERRRSQRSRILSSVLFVALGMMLLAVTAYYSYYSRLPVGLGNDPDREGVINVLLFGIDSGIGGAPRTDSIMLFSIDRSKGSVNAIAIPRDTRVKIEGRSRPERINAAHAHGGPELLMHTVEHMLGIDVDYFVRLDYEGFQAIINTLGGVILDVEQRMFYEDKAQDLLIDLQPGIQRLNGEQALQYMRYRSDGLGDVSVVGTSNVDTEYGGRIDRQLKLVKALLSQVFSAKNLLNAPQLVGDLGGSVTSNIPPDAALHLVMLLKEIEHHWVQTGILPGSTEMIGNASYWSYDVAKTRELVNKLVYRDDMIRVEVLNGNGIQGDAVRVANTLRENGYEVVSIGNADHFNYAITAVIAGDERLGAAKRLAGILGGLAQAELRDGGESAVSSPAEVVVIIGKDLVE